MGEGATPRPDFSRSQKTNAIRAITPSHPLISAVSAITHPSHCHHVPSHVTASPERTTPTTPNGETNADAKAHTRAKANIQT
jgi:hypothetical protein